MARLSVNRLFALRSTQGRSPLSADLSLFVAVVQPWTIFLFVCMTFPSIIDPVFTVRSVLVTCWMQVLLMLVFLQGTFARTDVLARPGARMLVFLMRLWAVLYTLLAQAGQ